MTGITTAEIKAKLERCWARGDLCRAALGHSDMFPWSIALGKPSSKQMLDDFSGTQDWVKLMQSFAQKKQVQLQWQSINHRTLGAQQLPSFLCLATPQQAASLMGKAQQLKQYISLYKRATKQHYVLQPWLLQYPLKVLALAEVWPQLLHLCTWMQCHPNPRIYLRQVDVAGVDSKFIEQHKRVLADLFDFILPVYAIDEDYSGVAGFARRYGFLDKPTMLRLRPLDKAIALLYSGKDHDVVMTARAFSALDVRIIEQVKRVVIVENEINYLAFPDMDKTLLIFGSGYGFEALRKVSWLYECALYYWGDLDTHGFAILNQLRASFPQVKSFLMDENTLMAHQYAWGVEPKQEVKDLKYLNQEEALMYDGLRSNRLSNKLRLEQERIAFDQVRQAVAGILRDGSRG